MLVTAVQWMATVAVAAVAGVGGVIAYHSLPAGTLTPIAADTTAPPKAPDCIKPIVLAAVGDVLLHDAFQKWAATRPESFFAAMKPVRYLLEAADVTIANLEGPAAANVAIGGRDVPPPSGRYDGNVYSGYPMFNYPPSIIGDLQKMGVDVLQTANNHAMDRGILGADRTIEAMDAAKIPHTGTRLSTATPAGYRWWTTFTVKRDRQDYRFAFISCAYGTNGMPDKLNQVLNCFDQRDELLAQVRAMRADPSIAAVVVMPHWGVEYQPQPNSDQTRLAQELADAGATAIIGTHPHVVEPEVMLTASDGRVVPVVYSLGNFVSWQIGLPRLSTAIYMLGFTPTRDGKLAATMTGWIPLRMRTGAAMSVDPLDRLSPAESAPFLAHLLKTFAAAKKLAADPAGYWNRTSPKVCAPAP